VTGNTYRSGRISIIDLLVQTETNFSSSLFTKLDILKRSVLSFPFQKGFPAVDVADHLLLILTGEPY
jgi:hypothetical protein